MRGLPTFDHTQLRVLRRAAGLTQGQLGAKVGADATAVSHWESGRRKPDVDTAQRLAEALHVDLTRLLLADSDPGVTPSLRVLRERAGLTQDEVASKLDIKAGAYSKLERGTTRLITPERLAALAAVLRVNETQILAALRIASK